MNLQEFIATTLRQIIDGVIEAQEYGKTKGAYVNRGRSYVTVSGEPSNRPRSQRQRDVEFDVALTVSESSEKGAQGGVKLAVFDAGGRGSTTKSSETASRIRFQIGVVLPVTWEAAS